MKANMQSALDQVSFDPKSPANISYVKARAAIEQVANNRSDRREAKMAVVALLKGEIKHHPLPASAKGKLSLIKKEVVFPDGTKARF